MKDSDKWLEGHIHGYEWGGKDSFLPHFIAGFWVGLATAIVAVAVCVISFR